MSGVLPERKLRDQRAVGAATGDDLGCGAAGADAGPCKGFAADVALGSAAMAAGCGDGCAFVGTGLLDVALGPAFDSKGATGVESVVCLSCSEGGDGADRGSDFETGTDDDDEEADGTGGSAAGLDWPTTPALAGLRASLRAGSRLTSRGTWSPPSSQALADCSSSVAWSPAGVSTP